jgi:hypothetical protein
MCCAAAHCNCGDAVLLPAATGHCLTGRPPPQRKQIEICGCAAGRPLPQQSADRDAPPPLGTRVVAKNGTTGVATCERDADGTTGGILAAWALAKLACSLLLCLWAFGPLENRIYMYNYTCIFFYQNLGYSKEYPGIPLTPPVSTGRAGRPT